MSTLVPLCYLIGINPKNFSKEENSLLEAELFMFVCDELKEWFRNRYNEFFKLMKFTKAMEDEMLEKNFIQLILKDILSTEEYTLSGIAYYVNTHEDVIFELVSGLNTKPLATWLRNTIELHRTVRHELYLSIGKKIAAVYQKIEM